MAQSGIQYLRVFATVVDGLGLLLTAWRIYFRLRIDRFWWEDAWAAILLLTGLFWAITYWVSLSTDGLTSIVTSWIFSIDFTCIVTLARLSVLFSIIRIIHGSFRLLRFAYACVAFFVACWVILIVEKVWQCASDPSWHQTTTWSPNPFCVVEPRISIFEFITDCVAVSILVVLPLHMLWRVKLPRRQRRMILSVFASGIVLAFAAIFHMVGQVLNDFVLMSVGFHVEIALSIIVCNLLVVVTYMYQFLLHDKAESGTTRGTTEDTSDDDDFTTRPRPPAPGSTLALTTVDFRVSLASTGQHQAPSQRASNFYNKSGSDL